MIWKSRTRSWQTDGILACGWERATSSRTSTLVRTNDGVVYAQSVQTTRQRTAGQKRTSSQSSRTPQKPRSTTTDDAADPRAVPALHEHENQDEEANENDGEDEESPDKPDGEDHGHGG